MVTVIDKIDALLVGMTRNDIEAMRPELRRRLARALRRVADIADAPKAEAPGAGVLADLKYGQRSD